MPSNIFQQILAKVVFKKTVFKTALNKNQKCFWNNCQNKSGPLRKVFQCSIPRNSSRKSSKIDLQKYYYCQTFFKSELLDTNLLLFSVQRAANVLCCPESVQASASVKASKHLKASQSVQAYETNKAYQSVKASQSVTASQSAKAN